ncbi:MAG: Hsp20/alpha crystallin family protein, partial [Vicinamibacterales bacterium]
ELRARQGGRQGELQRYMAPEFFSGNPFEIMQRMSDEMDRLFEDLGFGRSRLLRSAYGGASPAATWSPRIEAFQDGDRFIVRADLPGVKKDDLDVNLTDDAITIQGQRQQEQRDERQGYYRSERSYGSFYRAIPLPEGVIADSCQANFKDGVLEITMQAPPHEVSRGRRIDIGESSETSASSRSTAEKASEKK